MERRKSFLTQRAQRAAVAATSVIFWRAWAQPQLHSHTLSHNKNPGATRVRGAREADVRANELFDAFQRQHRKGVHPRSDQQEAGAVHCRLPFPLPSSVGPRCQHAWEHIDTQVLRRFVEASLGEHQRHLLELRKTTRQESSHAVQALRTELDRLRHFYEARLGCASPRRGGLTWRAWAWAVLLESRAAI
jgi:hypothetical protein